MNQYKELLILHKLPICGMTKTQSEVFINEYVNLHAPKYEQRGNFVIHNLTIPYPCEYPQEPIVEILESHYVDGNVIEKKPEQDVELIKS